MKRSAILAFLIFLLFTQFSADAEAYQMPGSDLTAGNHVDLGTPGSALQTNKVLHVDDVMAGEGLPDMNAVASAFAFAFPANDNSVSSAKEDENLYFPDIATFASVYSGYFASDFTSFTKASDANPYHESNIAEGDPDEAGDTALTNTSYLQDILWVNIKSFEISGQSDWTDAINHAIAYAVSIMGPKAETLWGPGRPTLYFPESDHGYATSKTIYVPAGINVVMDSEILYMPTDGKTILQIADSNSMGSGNHKIRVYRNTIDWDSGSVGVKIYNATTSNFAIDYTRNSAIGCQLLGSNRGFAYNSIRLNYFLDCKIGLNLHTEGAEGWLNENMFYGGRFGNSGGSYQSRYSRTAILLDSTSEDGMLGANIFYKPCFEIGNDVVAPAKSVPIYIGSGSRNVFYDCRNESNSEILAQLEGNSNRNLFSFTYGAQSRLLDNSSRRTNYIIKDYQKRMVYDSGFLPGKTYYHHVSGFNYYVKLGDLFSVSIESKASEEDFTPFVWGYNASPIEITDRYISQITGNRAFGRYFNSRYCKKFSVIVEGDYTNSPAHSFYILPYDANGQRIPVPDNKGNICIYGPGRETSYFGTSFYTGSSNPNGILFEVSQDVDYFVLLFTFEAGAKVVSIKVEQIINTGNVDGDVGSSSYSPFDWMNDGIYVEGVPTAGKWEKGQILTEYNPKINGSAFYVCLSSGDFASDTRPTFGKMGIIEAIKNK